MDDFDPARPPVPLSPNALAELRSLVRQMREVRGPWREEYGTRAVQADVYLWEAADELVMNRANHFLYAQERILFMDWEQFPQRDLLRGEWQSGTAELLDHLTTRKLLSFASRLNHWNDHAWEEMFEVGKGQKLFERLLELEEELATRR